MNSRSPRPAVYSGGRGIEPVSKQRARRLLADIGLYCLIIATTFVFAEFVRDPMPASELRYFWFYYIFTLPALAWGVVAVPALVAVDLFAARTSPSAHRRALIVAAAVLVALPAAYVFRDLPLILIFATGGGIYGWAYRSLAPASETK
jgi:hypothetical protein